MIEQLKNISDINYRADIIRTLNKDENMGGYHYLKEQCGMVPESLEPYIAKELWTDTTEAGYLQMLPGVCKTDGFFVARFRKKT